MRPHPLHLIESNRIGGEPGDTNGHAMTPYRGVLLSIRWSDGGGWDHVSVACERRTPTWEEMEFVRDQLFRDDECVMQLSVPRAEHINRHPHCLHMWRPQTTEEIALVKVRWGAEWPKHYPSKSAGVIPMPPAEMV